MQPLIKRHPILSLLGIVLLIGAAWGVLSNRPSEPVILAVVNDAVEANPSGVATLVYRFNQAPLGSYAFSMKLPEGWTLISPLEAVEVEQEKSTPLFLNVQIPQQMAAGRYPITLTATGPRTLDIQSEVVVKSMYIPRLTTRSNPVQAEQGKTIVLDYELTNIGNRPGSFELTVEAPSNWVADVLQKSPELQPGESSTISIQTVISDDTVMERKEVILMANGDGQAKATIKVYVTPPKS